MHQILEYPPGVGGFDSYFSLDNFKKKLKVICYYPIESSLLSEEKCTLSWNSVLIVRNSALMLSNINSINSIKEYMYKLKRNVGVELQYEPAIPACFL